MLSRPFTVAVFDFEAVIGANSVSDSSSLGCFSSLGDDAAVELRDRILRSPRGVVLPVASIDSWVRVELPGRAPIILSVLDLILTPMANQSLTSRVLDMRRRTRHDINLQDQL